MQMVWLVVWKHCALLGFLLPLVISNANCKRKAHANCAQIQPTNMQNVRQIIQQILLSYYANAVTIDKDLEHLENLLASSLLNSMNVRAGLWSFIKQLNFSVEFFIVFIGITQCDTNRQDPKQSVPNVPPAGKCFFESVLCCQESGLFVVFFSWTRSPESKRPIC